MLVSLANVFDALESMSVDFEGYALLSHLGKHFASSEIASGIFAVELNSGLCIFKRSLEVVEFLVAGCAVIQELY